MTEKQRQFCEQYLIDLNATQSAIRAGYSKKTAYSIGQENLKKPEIQNKIQKLMAKRSSRTLVKADDVLKEIAIIAFSNIGEVINISDNQITFVGSNNTNFKAVRNIEVVKPRNGYQSIKVAMYDKVKALELLGRHLNLFNGTVTQKINCLSAKGKLLEALNHLSKYKKA